MKAIDDITGLLVRNNSFNYTNNFSSVIKTPSPFYSFIGHLIFHSILVYSKRAFEKWSQNRCKDWKFSIVIGKYRSEERRFILDFRHMCVSSLNAHKLYRARVPQTMIFPKQKLWFGSESLSCAKYFLTFPVFYQISFFSLASFLILLSDPIPRFKRVQQPRCHGTIVTNTPHSPSERHSKKYPYFSPDHLNIRLLDLVPLRDPYSTQKHTHKKRSAPWSIL